MRNKTNSWKRIEIVSRLHSEGHYIDWNALENDILLHWVHLGGFYNSSLFRYLFFENLYLIYIRPILEYAGEVWDNCSVSNSCKLERLQLEAARIITGLPIFTNTEYLYRETGWERLEERRTRRKLQLLPSYLLDLISRQSKVRLFIPFEMATILLFHSVDYL